MNPRPELVDLHCHLMPYVDDGAYDEDECLALLKMEAEQGVGTICLTPHLRADMFETTDADVESHFALVQRLTEEASLPLKLCFSREYHFDRLFRERLRSGGLRPLGAGRFLLVEFGWSDSAEDMRDAVRLVRQAGYSPLIAHVERCAPLHEDWAFAHTLREGGASLQINAGSVLGREGLRQKQLTRKLLQHGLVDVIASDAHDTEVRRPELDRCAQFLEKKYGRETAQRLLSGNPNRILQGLKE